ncbi:hypothetical protein LR48_Vigan06g134900 [Vigna angularis]|uniref:Insecticidal crystal toxin domain-containing protein n=1 Tax=Phaseolus angularis TaxID=3914 RepID=A0A0L9UTH9_PHAAN|nr:hypothetical protein LR48_Vigan06g134900 [Vigna angularis]
MYVTRPLSMYKRNPGALSEPPAGPNSGYLVIFDEEAQTYSCFGLCKDSTISDLPFPQDKNLTINYGSDDEEALFVPVLNQPLSSNRYYVIRKTGKHQGEASTSSKEEDMGTCLCCSFVSDVKSRPLDPSDVYQQVEIIKKNYGFQAKSVASDGLPAGLLRNKGWTAYGRTPSNYHLREALGANDSLRAKLPGVNFPLSNDRSESVVVGKWYCPFMFVKEGIRLKEQMKKSVFYELTLEQRWEKIFSKENNEHSGENHAVFIDVVVQTEVAKVAGKEAVWDEDGVDNEKVVWFRSFGDGTSERSVGLSLEIVNGMKWEQERVGWIAGNERQVRVERGEKFEGTINKWVKFGCYVLVESFILRAMDGRLVLSYEFRHKHQIKCKWE